jgi:hypothetical protein
VRSIFLHHHTMPSDAQELATIDVQLDIIVADDHDHDHDSAAADAGPAAVSPQLSDALAQLSRPPHQAAALDYPDAVSLDRSLAQLSAQLEQIADQGVHESLAAEAPAQMEAAATADTGGEKTAPSSDEAPPSVQVAEAARTGRARNTASQVIAAAPPAVSAATAPPRPTPPRPTPFRPANACFWPLRTRGPGTAGRQLQDRALDGAGAAVPARRSGAGLAGPQARGRRRGRRPAQATAPPVRGADRCGHHDGPSCSADHAAPADRGAGAAARSAAGHTRRAAGSRAEWGHRRRRTGSPRRTVLAGCLCRCLPPSRICHHRNWRPAAAAPRARCNPSHARTGWARQGGGGGGGGSLSCRRHHRWWQIAPSQHGRAAAPRTHGHWTTRRRRRGRRGHAGADEAAEGCPAGQVLPTAAHGRRPASTVTAHKQAAGRALQRRRCGRPCEGSGGPAQRYAGCRPCASAHWARRWADLICATPAFVTKTSEAQRRGPAGERVVEQVTEAITHDRTQGREVRRPGHPHPTSALSVAPPFLARLGTTHTTAVRSGCSQRPCVTTEMPRQLAFETRCPRVVLQLPDLSFTPLLSVEQLRLPSADVRAGFDAEVRRWVARRRRFGESKRLLVESPCSQLTSECQRFRYPPRLDK